ncbi:MAG: hypothetical protein J1G38_02435 [Clostridiales bacterium]|nr:hypothetical protein [Clostridiales bacterium]
MEAENKKSVFDSVKAFFVKVGTAIKTAAVKFAILIKDNFKVPGIGFIFLFAGFIMAIVSFANYYALYDMAGYKNNRWTVMFSWMGILLIVFLMINALFKGDRPRWLVMIVYAVTPFLLISAMLQFLQPCISEIAFVLGSPDLAMGDNEIRVAISDDSIATAVMYAVTCVLLIIAAFVPNVWTFGAIGRRGGALVAQKSASDETAQPLQDSEIATVAADESESEEVVPTEQAAEQTAEATEPVPTEDAEKEETVEQEAVSVEGASDAQKTEGEEEAGKPAPKKTSTAKKSSAKKSSTAKTSSTAKKTTAKKTSTAKKSSETVKTDVQSEEADHE